MLLSNGADVNAADHAGITPLMLAASIPSPIHAATLIELLSQNGARAQLCDKTGETVMMKAAVTGSTTSANLGCGGTSGGASGGAAVTDVFACCYCLCMLLHLQVFLPLHVLFFVHAAHAAAAAFVFLWLLLLLLLLHAAATDALHAAATAAFASCYCLLRTAAFARAAAIA